MEDLLETQHQLITAIEQLYSNFKKDGAERKTPDSIKRRLETLQQYWKDFENNHVTLCGYGIRSHCYFTNKQFEQTKERYEHIVSALKNYPVREGKPANPLLKPATFFGEAGNHHQHLGAEPSTSRPATPGSNNQGEVIMQPATYTVKGIDSKTDEMLRKQASNFRAFQRTVTNIELDTVTEKWEFDHLLRTVQSRWSAIDTLHLEIDSELEGRNQEYDQMFYHYEATFNKIIKTINKKMWSVSHREKSTPQMELPTFNGCFQQWTSFKDLFTETIHTNPSLSGAQKMQFLKGKIKGEAERLVQHLQITSDNYSICWDILNHRYNNKKLIFTSHINTLINIPVINQVSFTHIKRLHDTSLETLNAIKNLGLDISTWDPLLVHLLAQKLDPDTHNEYIASLKQPRELPILHDFLDFLESKFIALETARKRQENPGYKTTHNYQDAKQFKKPYFKQSFASNNKVEQSTLNNKNMKPGIICPVCAVRGHALYCCTKFIEMSPQAKRQYITNNNICKNCLYDHNNKVCFSEKRCKICNAAHNTILHNAFLTNINNKGEALNQTKRSTMGNPEQLHGTSHVSQQNDVPEILLATAIVTIEAHDGSYHHIRALIDQGSQTSLISERTVQALGIPRRMCRGVVSGIGEKESNCKGVVTLHCAATNSDFTFTTEALIMKSLIKNLPSCSFPKPNWPLLRDIQLADPDFNTSKPVELLLGADVYSDILLDGICRTGPKLPIAQRTRLGWILSGHVEQTLQCNVVLNDISSIQRFWNIEDIESGSELTSTDQRVLDFYQSTTIRREDGRYEVRLPLKRDVEEELGSSKPMAIAQFRQLERKFNNNPTFAIKYKEFMREYLSLGHMTKSVGNETPSYYLPHHGVLRDQSETTKLRTVFNGSAKTDSGKSLNDLMEGGPNLQQDLQGIIIKWRQYKIAFTSDIEKFFRQIGISQQDQKYQKIIWRDSVEEPLQDYQLTTVTYGTKAAPFLAMMTLRQLAKDERSNYEGSLALEAIETSIYTDDLVYGSHSVESAKLIIKYITSLLQSGGFHLRKWKSNHPNILGAANHDPKQEEYSFKQPDCSAKTLGLGWNPKTDEFTFSLDLHLSKQTTTKRLLLSEISRLFDPLGWLSPITTKLKLLFQQVWQNDLKWDDPLPDNIHKQWVKLNTDINKTKQFKLPRWIGSTENDQIELHGFSDASGKAYACVVYCKITRSGHTSIAMIAGKTRLVPLNKQISLPKLELSGALLLSQLIDKIKHNLPCYDIKIYCWVDSMVVLGWINGDPDRWKTFVSNRVSKIKQVIPAECWRYVKSSENPADCASRGLTASQLKDHKLWWDGPTWLSSYNASCHNETKFNTDQELRKAINIVSVATNQESIINQLLYKYSSLSKVINTLSWIYRFISRDGQSKPPYLTPAHFLTNGPTLAFYSTEIDMRTRWYLTRNIFEGIWKRWSCEYLSQLSSRSKWRQERTNLKVDDIVVIHDANLPAGKWALGRVVQLHPGSDGHVRVVSLKTKTGIMKRPIVKLSILPTNPDKSNEDQQLSINAQKTESNSSQPKEKSRARKTNYSFPKMAFSLLLFIMTLITSTEGAYNITPIQTSQQGLYFDKVANMNVIRDEWRLVVYYDMGPYKEGTRALIKYIDYLQKACNPIQTQSYCQAFISQLEHGLNELQHYNNILQNKKLTRQRRGLINGVGNIANSLFGVLDSQFAEKYEQDITIIRKNQAHVALLLKNQTSIVEAEFNVLKRTEQIINKDHKVINERLQTLENAVQGVLSNNAAIADFALSALIANNLLLRLKDIQNTLVDTIADIYNGQLNLHLLTPDQLRQQLILITSQIPNDLLLPIDLANLSTAYHLLKIKASMTSNYLISEVTLPLVSRDNYEIHKVISIPQAINNSNMTYVLPVSSYLAINIKKDAMLLMTQMDFKSCLHKEPDVMLCSLNSPVYHIKDDQNLCLRDPVTRQCKTTLTRCESQWIDLHNINHYFYFCCSSCPMKLLCDVDIIQLNLSNAGIFTTNQGCAVKSKHFTVYTHKQGMTNLYVKPGILTPQISPINHIISIPIPPTNVEPIFSDHDQQMRDIQNQIDTMKQTVPLYSDMSPHDVHHYVISYVIVGILITIAAAFIIHRRCRSQQRQQPAAVAIGMSGAAPAVEIGPQSAAPLRRQGQCSAMCSVSGPSTKSERKDAECVYSKSQIKVNRSSSPVLRSFYVAGNNSDRFNSV